MVASYKSKLAEKCVCAFVGSKVVTQNSMSHHRLVHRQLLDPASVAQSRWLSLLDSLASSPNFQPLIGLDHHSVFPGDLFRSWVYASIECTLCLHTATCRVSSHLRLQQSVWQVCGWEVETSESLPLQAVPEVCVQGRWQTNKDGPSLSMDKQLCRGLERKVLLAVSIV